MQWGILVVIIILFLVAYVLIQETRAQGHWRGLVQKGDVDAIRQLIDDEINRWHTERPPREVPPLVWHGVQTAEVTGVTAHGARVNCSAEGEYTLVNGRRVETSSPLAEGMKITKKLSDMMLYDIPNLRLDYVQVDVYTSFRDEHGQAATRCILSSVVDRAVVQDLDWEAASGPEFIAVVGGRFAADEAGGTHPVEPLPWTEDAPEEEAE